MSSTINGHVLNDTRPEQTLLITVAGAGAAGCCRWALAGADLQTLWKWLSFPQLEQVFP